MGRCGSLLFYPISPANIPLNAVTSSEQRVLLPYFGRRLSQNEQECPPVTTSSSLRLWSCSPPADAPGPNSNLRDTFRRRSSQSLSGRMTDSTSNTVKPVTHDSDSAVSFPYEPTALSSNNTTAAALLSPNSPTFPHSAQPSQTEAEQVLTAAENAAAVNQAETLIDVDNFSPAGGHTTDNDDFSDAGYDTDSVQSATTSLTSSVRQFSFENGRRYHKFREGAYNFPNDDTEQDREDMKHAMMMNLCQQLHFAPIGDTPQRILDMGTGTGIWAIEMGEKYESATVLGVDLSPIQPTWVPPNVKFTVDDVESPWLHPRDHFDFIHSRHTVMAFKDWPRLLNNVYDHLKPGGWYEMQEIHHFPQCHDGTMPPDHPVSRYWSLISQGLGHLGVDFTKTLALSQLMRDAGFVNITERVFHVPIGLWPKNRVLKGVGLFWRTILMDGLSPIALGPLTRGLGWSREDVDAWLEGEVRAAYMDSWCHSHMPLHVIYGQKPERL